MKCSRCGKEIEIAPLVLNEFYRINDNYHIIHLCEDCRKEYDQFILGRKLCLGKCEQ